MINLLTGCRLRLGCSFLFLALVSGCMDDPSSVGSRLIPSTDLLQIDTAMTVATGSFSEKATPLSFAAAPTTFAIGKSENFEAWGLLRFTGLSDTLSQLVLEGADLHLRAAYHLGDPLGQFSINLHKALLDWNRTSFVYDSLMAPGVYEAASAPVTLGSFGDTDNVLIPLDTALVRSWFRAVIDTTFRNYGIVLEPTNSAVIKGFESNVTSNDATFRPYVAVRYTDRGTGLTDTLLLTSVINKFVAGMADTTVLKDSTLLIARAGAAYRSVITFDISSVPAHALVHRAYFEIHTDPAASRFASIHHDSLYALFPHALNPIQISESIADSAQDYFRFNVTEFLQSMVHGSGAPQISIAAFDEENAVEFFRIFGSAATDPNKRPRLTILYSRTR